ncbi:MAG: lactate racemase domain-containing protein [Anaerolineaceae bacterium]|nr:lactate racemase domain-containing protein [Anaerolineaceae bacterium]
MLTEEQVIEKVEAGLASLPLQGKRVLVIIPDPTRTMPLPLFFRTIVAGLKGRAAAVDFLVALGTHPSLTDEELLHLVGISAEEKQTRYADVHLFNHAWQDPEALVQVGTITSEQVEQISRGLLHQSVAVRLNKLILDYDHLLVCGPVFPHEVVGFSGGNKYFFPGIAGPDIIDLSHWLGALITSYEIIGTKDTPVRALINLAASFIPRPRSAICVVDTQEGVAGVFCGTPEEAWSQAADLSAQVHIRWVDKPYQTVLSVMPLMYNEIWVGAKGMYKMEPVVADGGEVIIYAPHIHEFSVVHGKYIKQIGYHVRDYFVKQPGKFTSIPGGVLAHSTHLRGKGTYDPVSGIESPRIRVTLATGIPEAECRAVNLGYRDPAGIDVDEWLSRQDENLLVVPRAGEFLYRLKKKE